jgi:hypothetical protein
MRDIVVDRRRVLERMLLTLIAVTFANVDSKGLATALLGIRYACELRIPFLALQKLLVNRLKLAMRYRIDAVLIFQLLGLQKALQIRRKHCGACCAPDLGTAEPVRLNVATVSLDPRKGLPSPTVVLQTQ